MTPPISTHHEIDRHIKIDVPEFDEEQGVDAFLDWKHRVKSFKWHDLSEVRNLQFVESKLNGTAKIWWSTYKKSQSKFGNGEITIWGEMKIAIKKRFAPWDYKQITHIQMMQLKLGQFEC